MRSSIVVAAVSAAAVSVAVPVALAAKPEAGKLYGGGTIGPKFVSGGHPDVNLVEVAVAKNRRTVTVGAQVNERCTAPLQPGSVVPFKLKGGKLRRDGSFTVTGPISSPGPAGNETGTATVTGRFTGPGRVVGTVVGHTTVKLNTGAQGTCDTGKIHYQSDLPGAKGQTGARIPGAAFFGTSRTPKPLGNVPVALRLAGTPNEVAQFATPFYMRCKSGNVVSQTEIAPAGKISKTGRFTIVDKYPQPVAQGITGDFVATIKGRFGRSDVAGTFEQVATIKNASGAQVDTCSTGLLHWKASR